jgi:hypothetical protein
MQGSEMSIGSPLNQFIEKNKRNALSASMPALNAINGKKLPSSKLALSSFEGVASPTNSSSSSTSGGMSRSQSLDAIDTTGLFSYLGRSLSTIEKDLEERLPQLSPKETDGLMKNFSELKQLVEASVYAATSPGSGSGEGRDSVSGRGGGGLFSKMKRMKGLFQG